VLIILESDQSFAFSCRAHVASSPKICTTATEAISGDHLGFLQQRTPNGSSVAAQEDFQSRIASFQDSASKNWLAVAQNERPVHSAAYPPQALLGGNSPSVLTTAFVCGQTPMGTINPPISNAHSLSLPC
jgi:hypothetical protein